MNKPRKGQLVTIIGAIFIIVSLLYLGKSFTTGITEAGGLQNLLQFDVSWFLIATAFLIIHLVVAGYTWALVTNASGGKITLKQGFSIHFLSQIGKYVPGKIWAAMGKYSLSRSVGLTNIQVGQGLVLETIFIVLGCILTTIPLVSVAATDSGYAVSSGIMVATGLSIILLFMLHPIVFRKISSLIQKVMKSHFPIKERSFFEMLRILLVYVFVFVALGIAFWFLSLSFGLSMPFFPGIFIYPAAMGIGYLVIFAPGGIGARELTTVWLIHLIAPNCEPGLAEMVALAARLWITIGEALGFAVSFWLFGVTPSSLKKLMLSGRLSDGDSTQ